MTENAVNNINDLVRGIRELADGVDLGDLGGLSQFLGQVKQLSGAAAEAHAAGLIGDTEWLEGEVVRLIMDQSTDPHSTMDGVKRKLDELLADGATAADSPVPAAFPTGGGYDVAVEKGIEQRLESLAQAASQADVDNLATLAVLLQQLQELTKSAPYTTDEHLANLAQKLESEASALVMDQSPDPEKALQNIRRGLAELRSGEAGSEANPLRSDPSRGETEQPLRVLSPESEPTQVQYPEMLEEFLAQHGNALSDLESHLLRMEGAANQEGCAAALRILHSLKGDAGFLGLDQIERLCHAAEGYIEEKGCDFDVEPLLAVKDWLTEALNLLAAGRPLHGTIESLLAALAVPELGDENGGETQTPQTAHPAEATPPAPDRDSPRQPTAENDQAVQVAEGEAEAVVAEVPGETVIQGDTDILLSFVSEAKESVEEANAQLLSMEEDPANGEAIDAVFRTFHTLKGTAGFLDLTDMSTLSHQAENLLDMVRKGKLTLDNRIMDVFFEVMDGLERLIESLAQALQSDGRMAADPELPQLMATLKAATSGQQDQAPPPDTGEKKLGEILVENGVISKRVLNEALAPKTDGEANQKIGERLIRQEKASPKQVASALRRQKSFTSSPRELTASQETIRVNYDRLDEMINAIGELVITESMITQDESVQAITSESFKKKLHSLTVLTRQLQSVGTSIRMVPIAGVFQKMARLVRDLSRKSGKEIQFRTHGEETELDRVYIDLISDPLVHMIRNAVDHGIEPAETREQTGKPRSGLIELQAFHESGNINIVLRDDGRGLDRDAILNKALESGLVRPEDRLSDAEIFDLIFRPGFSTSKSVTEISGRGVGMDVVKRNINSMRGTVLIDSEPGQGTRFQIALPLTLALIDGLVVTVGDERFIFPVQVVVESFQIKPEMIATIAEKGEVVTLRKNQIQLHHLSRIFEVNGACADSTKGIVVVVECMGKQYGILVDRVIGIQQTVLKNLGRVLGSVPGISGGAIMADGTVGLILDIHNVLAATKYQRTTAVPG